MTVGVNLSRVRPSRSGPVTPTSVRDRAFPGVLPGAAPWRWVMSATAASFPDGRRRRVSIGRRPPSQPQRWYRAHLGVVNRCPTGRRR